MKHWTRVLFLVGPLMAISGIASANTINFDEFPATNNNVALTNAYAGLGVTFDNRNSGTQGGIANGDPGNWGVDGTNGPQFLGDNGLNNGDTYAESIFFATGWTVVSFDASRTNGSSAGQTLTANAYDAASSLVATETLTLGDINTWSTFSLSGPDITQVDLMGSANGFSPYAVDNLQFNSVPEPASAFGLALGLLSFGIGKIRRLTKTNSLME